jgi:hypothetical protein
MPKMAQGETLLVSPCTLFQPPTGPRSPTARQKALRPSALPLYRLRRGASLWDD